MIIKNNPKEDRSKFKAMTSQQRKLLILKKMKEKGIEVGSGVNGSYMIRMKLEI